jgi:hypothetical protein
MTRFLHSNLFFAVSVMVLAVWAAVLYHPVHHIKAIECPYRVSTRGLVHGPESPWWSSTMPHHCFNSRNAAEEFAEGWMGR